LNIHILSDTPNSSSAYSKIVRGLSDGLCALGHNITITGFISDFSNYHGMNVLPLATPFTSAEQQFSNNLRSSKAEALVCIHEVHKYQNRYSQMFSPTYFWIGIEGEGSSGHMIRDLKYPTIKQVIPYSIAGKKELESKGVSCNVIYPGYDPTIFTYNPSPHCNYSMDMYQRTADIRKLIRNGCFDCDNDHTGGYSCSYFENETMIINLDGKEREIQINRLNEIKDLMGVEFVIGCVAQNIGTRKKLERLIEAFSKMENSKECLLHLHTLPNSLKSVIDLHKVAELWNIEDRVIFSYGINPVQGISDYGINLLYNYFDIHATATSYEGFGMPILESMAVGKPQVVPACGTGFELIGENERGLLATIDKMVIEEDLLRGIVNIESMVDKMDSLVISKFLRKKLGNAGKEWAKQFTWDKVALKWDKVLNQEREQTQSTEKDHNKLLVTA
jgi:glycosyltransferase involved in cell wall biosynthesis